MVKYLDRVSGLDFMVHLLIFYWFAFQENENESMENFGSNRFLDTVVVLGIYFELLSYIFANSTTDYIMLPTWFCGTQVDFILGLYGFVIVIQISENGSC